MLPAPPAGGDQADAIGQATIVSTLGDGATQPVATWRVRVASLLGSTPATRTALIAVGPVNAGSGKAGGLGSGTGTGRTDAGLLGFTAAVGSFATNRPPAGTLAIGPPALSQ